MNCESAELPDIKFFDVDSMNEDRGHCERWHHRVSRRIRSQGASYNLRSEMLKYCYDDCLLLSIAFTRFNESMICELKQAGVTGIIDHEFTILADFITLPQMVIHWFVGCMMPARFLAIVPNCGYDNRKHGSVKENVWLAYLEKMHEELEGDSFIPIDSRYCTGRKQQQIRHYHLDSFRMLPDGSRECFEFYGCYYHECMECFPDRTKVVHCKYRENCYITIERAYIDTIERERN